MEKIKVSIIMPCYNSAKWVRRTILSVLNQNYSNWQLICIDDGSSDETLQILQEYASKDDRILALHKENEKSAYKARLFGIAYVKGELLTNLDSDDMLENNYLKLGVKRYDESGADIMVGDIVYEEDEGSRRCFCIDNDTKWLTRIISGRESFSYLIDDWRICGHTLFKSAFAKKHYCDGCDGMNGDEYLVHVLFINANKIAFFTGGGESILQ